jgi:hypothetical protein
MWFSHMVGHIVGKRMVFLYKKLKLNLNYNILIYIQHYTHNIHLLLGYANISNMNDFYFYFLSDALKLAVSNFRDVKGLMVSDDDMMEYVLDDPYIWNHVEVPNKNPDKLIDMVTIYNYPNKINLRYCDKLTDNSLLLLEYTHTLDLSGCVKITDGGLNHLNNAHTLNLTGCYNITDGGLIHMDKVHTLNLTHCDKITDKGLIHLESLHTLDLSRCKKITGRGIKYLLNNGVNIFVDFP